MHPGTRSLLRVILAGTVIFVCGATSLPAQEPAATPADNTKVNKRDRSKSEATADQAKNNATDRELMQKIRQALMDDKSLSTYAHNIKVIAQNGQVTLKGPVRTEEEKTAVESKAAEIAGADHVISKLAVKPSKPSKES